MSLALVACGAADERVDPADLALRDLLGVAPKVAVDWDAEQRLAARQLLADGLVERDAEALANPAPLLDDVQVIGALAAVDLRLLDREHDALGLVMVDHPEAAAQGRPIDAPVATAALLGELVTPTLTLELDPQAWPCAAAPACNLDTLAALAADAAPGATRIRVLPVVQLAVIAALVTDADGVPTLLVNPIVTAVSEPTSAAVTSAGGGSVPGFVAPVRQRLHVLPLITSTWAYGGTIGSCASSVQNDCQVCLTGGACPEIWSGVSGNQACTTLDAQAGQNYSLLCINLAVSLGDVGSCMTRTAPSCGFDTSAILTPAKLSANSNFVGNATCHDALDACLAELYGGTSSASGCDCGGCDCGSCSDKSSTSSCNDSSNGSTSGCGNNSNGCSSGGNNCGGGGSGGSCTVARAPAQGPGLATGVVWVLLPVPAALFARRRARRGRSSTDADPTPPTDPA